MNETTPNNFVQCEEEQSDFFKSATRSACYCPKKTRINESDSRHRCFKFNYTKYFWVFLVIILFIADTTFGSNENLLRRKRYSPAVFPSNSEIEVAWEVGIPVGLEGKDVEVGLFLEADYSLPDNVTYLYPDNILDKYTGKRRRRRIQQRRDAEKKKRGPITRAALFTAIEATMESLGMDGRSCLLRSICEAAETPFYHGSLVAELLHVLFTPSTTTENEIDYEYVEAEELGKKSANCYNTYADCPKSIFDMITTVQEY